MAAGGKVHNRTTPLLDDLEERFEQIRILIRSAIYRVAGMQVNDGCTRLGGTDRCIGDFLRRHRQMR